MPLIDEADLAGNRPTRKRSQNTSGKCSGCKNRRAIIMKGPRGQFCQKCADEKQQQWAKLLKGYSLDVVDAKLSNDGLKQ